MFRQADVLKNKRCIVFFFCLCFFFSKKIVTLRTTTIHYGQYILGFHYIGLTLSQEQHKIHYHKLYIQFQYIQMIIVLLKKVARFIYPLPSPMAFFNSFRNGQTLFIHEQYTGKGFCFYILDYNQKLLAFSFKFIQLIFS